MYEIERGGYIKQSLKQVASALLPSGVHCLHNFEGLA